MEPEVTEPAVEEVNVSGPDVARSADDPTLTISDRWRAIVDRIRTASPRHGASLAFGRVLWIRPGEVALAYAKDAGFHRSTVTASSGKALIEKHLSEHFAQATQLRLEDVSDLAAAAPMSLAHQDAASRQTLEKSTDAMVRSHPAVRAVLQHLGGEIEHIQLLEKERAPAQSADGDDEPA